VKMCMQNSLLIPDERMRREVNRCIAIDDLQSPIVDKIRQYVDSCVLSSQSPNLTPRLRTVGVEHEFILQERLKSLNIPFRSEGDLRSDSNSTKTPDVRLTLPIRTQFPLTSDQPFLNVTNFGCTQR
jgi:hypothetical protein